MQLSKEEYTRKRIHNGFEVLIKNSITWVTARHHSTNLVMPYSYPCDGIFNQHLTTLKKDPIVFSSIQVQRKAGSDCRPNRYCSQGTAHDGKKVSLYKFVNENLIQTV